MTSVGVDVVEIARVERLLQRHPGVRSEVFTTAEVECCERAARPGERYAARLCAKEAAFKALGVDGLSGEADWAEIEVSGPQGSAPALVLHGEMLRRFRACDFSRASVSVSHSRHTAVAVVVLEGACA